ncbi:hypothetical protein BP5796_00589 [Coleophoma crateriformis]|uniref:DUF7053 domain-containing protein n=1 Tax=Coleophoma crateriformis TaxID=565419 RepID=A0A3D8T8F4_9HELO|nr:hypothetical protein BP5796_00589 [Coleophoma crateriformis]
MLTNPSGPAVLNTTTDTVTVTKLPIHITRAQVLALLHDHDRMITMNPLVTAHHLQPASMSATFFKNELPEHKPQVKDGVEVPIPIYSITDDMSGGSANAGAAGEGEEQAASGGSWRGGWAKRFIPDAITYNAAIQNREDGMLTITHAPMGVHSTTTWLVRDAEDGSGGLVLEERGRVSSNRMLMGFIKTTLQESHDKLVKDFVAVLEREAAKFSEATTTASAQKPVSS